jgi:hypothetical protein
VCFTGLLTDPIFILPNPNVFIDEKKNATK